MASKKKQKGMVLHQEGAAAPAADHPSARCVPLRPGKASKGGMEESEEANIRGKRNMHPSKEAIGRTGGLKCPASSNLPSDNLSPDSICKGIRVTLDNNSMWNEFFRCRTEMILTKEGSRMFPYCRFRISGLQPLKKYSLIMDIQPLDNSSYRWSGKSWHVAGKAECCMKSRPFAHPESPATGQHWMQSPVSFYRLKLTNNISDQEGNAILHPMHRYLPQLHVVQTDKAAKDIKLSGPSVTTFTFPQTEFIAVTAYQNTRFAQLKVDYNPFAKGLKEDGSSSWGLKLKANAGKELHKDGGSTATQQHPVKKSLKSLLANLKPRSSKAVDPNPLVPQDLQKHPTTNKDQAAAPEPRESSWADEAVTDYEGNHQHHQHLSCFGHGHGSDSWCPTPFYNWHPNTSSSPPAQKLFSELIREAHVSLQRCNLEQLGLNPSTPLQVEHANTKTPILRGQDVPQEDSPSVRPATRKGGTVGTKRKVKEDNHLLTSLSCKDACPGAAGLAGSQTGSEASNHQGDPEAPSEAMGKQLRRPARLPLPALALFLKQHSTKSKKTTSRVASPPPAPRSEALSEPRHATSAASPSQVLSDVTKADTQESGGPGADLVPDIAGRRGAAAATDPLRPGTDDPVAAIPESPGPELMVPDGTPVLPNSDQPFCALGASIPTLSSTLTTSSISVYLSPRLDTVLPAPSSPRALTESSTLHPDSPPLKPEPLLPDPECSSFGFEPLSPASSPEPLPPLPSSLALELNATAAEAGCPVGHPEDSVLSRDSSVFKWHTVLLPPEPYVDTSFTTFQPAPQTLSLTSVTSPSLPSQTSSHPDTPPSFQENEQSLPFPAELSPLALQLPLSPTFSSLDGGGLSPTPSIADLVHFFSTDEDLGMGVEFSAAEAVPAPCPPPPIVEAHEPSQQVQPVAASKPCRSKRKSRRQQLAKTNKDQKVDDSAYRSMQPNLEEVEEQLFISFTSKEALRLHTADPSEGPGSQPQTAPEGQQTAVAPENVDSLEETVAAFQNILLRDLKLMKHRQVIHPVLQEVGLKMTLLDPTLAIDLQYLGVRLPIPPPGVVLEPLTQELPSCQGVSAAFVSRTGKTTDVTQIKGWREKYSPSEAPPTPVSSRPEAGPSSDLQKKNLSAFCSDMLDEYLENEGRLIDERAASFSQPPVEPPVYELPAKSTSYVRTLDHILKKPADSPPSLDLISGFIPPSKRPRLREAKVGRRAERKQRGPRQSRPAPGPAEPKQPAGPEPSPTPHKRRRVKPRTSSQTLGPPRSALPPVDLAPLESDSELGLLCSQSEDGGRRDGGRRGGGPRLTQALLRQRELEDGVLWEGRPRTSITEERAAIALTSLFTLTGFVSENPTAPIQLARRRSPSCLNAFCRLGCVCRSLAHISRVAHCGRPACMLGCSCLKQKVVLLRSLDGSDSSPSAQHAHSWRRRRRRRRRRMKMAYILKEADSVSQPAERVRTLWRGHRGDSDPEPVHIPEASPRSSFTDDRESRSSCARVRRFRGKVRKLKEAMKDVKRKAAGLKKQRHLVLEDATSCPPAGEVVQPPPPPPPPPPPSEPTPKPSKRLFIVADCQWASDGDRIHTLKKLCEAMAQDQLDKPFWIRKYLISPVSQTAEGSGADRCIQYKVHVSRPKLEQDKPAAAGRPGAATGSRREMEPAQHREDGLGQVGRGAEPPEAWQREVEDDDVKEEQGGDVTKRCIEKVISERKMVGSTALPFLTGISPAGFLSANRRQPGGTDHLVQVNGKLYPLAKIQLGKMGALHPANRLAAYLTGRVGSSRQQRASPSPSSSSSSSSVSGKPPESSGPTPHTTTSASSVLTDLTSVTGTATTPSPSDFQPFGSVVGPGNPPPGSAPPKGSRVLKVQVQGPLKPAPLGPRLPAVTSSGQRIVLQPVQTASGIQYYRRPDGKLVQLIPLSQLRLVTPTPAGLTGPPSSTSVHSAASCQTPAVTVVNQPSPPTATSSSAPPLCASLPPGCGFQKGSCTFKILPARSGSDPIVVTSCKITPQPPTEVVKAPGSFTLLHPHPPDSPTAPVNLISLTPSTGHGVEVGVKTVTVSAVPPTPGELLVQTPPTETIHRPPPPTWSEVTPADRSSPERELACDFVDLDIVCVDDEVVNLTSSSETDNSSDFRESDSDDERQPTVNSQRHLHSMLERKRRGQLQRLFEGLRMQVGLTKDKTSKIITLKKAVHVIEELRRTETHLKKRKRRLRKRREEILSSISPPTAAHTEVDLTGLMDETSDEERVVAAGTSRMASTNSATADGRLTSPETSLCQEDKGQEEDVTVATEEANSCLEEIGAATPPAGGMASYPPPAGGGGSDITMTSYDLQRTPQAPPTPVSALPTPTPVQKVPQALPPVLARPAMSHNAPMLSERPRTIPNILSRSKNLTSSSSLRTKTAESDAPSFLVPAEVLSLVQAALPGQPVLTLGPLVAGPTVLQTAPTPGVASVTLNIPSLANQQIHLTSLPRPPTGKIYSDSTPLTDPLQLVQPATTQQQQTQQQARPPQPQLVPVAPLPPLAVSAGSDRIRDQDPPLLQTDLRPQSLSAERLSEGRAGGPLGPQTQGDGENESLTSLLNEIAFLSQQTAATATSPGELSSEDAAVLGKAEERRHTCSPWLLQLDSDSETEGAGLNGHTETMQTGDQPGAANENTKGGALAPPPLLQMKVGGAKVVDSAGNNGAAAVGGGGGGRRERGAIWRPMPRLVPLGLRGNPPS